MILVLVKCKKTMMPKLCVVIMSTVNTIIYLYLENNQKYIAFKSTV